MDQVSVINIEESIGKTVGRRKPPNYLCPKTHREKDRADLLFLREHYPEVIH